jgi:hypothetical protein
MYIFLHGHGLYHLKYLLYYKKGGTYSIEAELICHYGYFYQVMIIPLRALFYIHIFCYTLLLIAEIKPKHS